MELRPYQNEAVDSILKSWEDGKDKVILSLATGLGKTIVFSKVVEKRTTDGSRALILAHREELLTQARDKIKLTSNLDTVLEKAESKALGSKENIVVASVQTLTNETRLNKYPKDYFSTIVVDEAHHTLADSYLRILHHFEGAKVLGVTATCDRGDKRSLGEFYEDIAYQYGMRQGIKDGYLSPIKSLMIPLELNLNEVSISNGDYALNEVGNAIKPYLNQIALEMVKYCKNRKTVVFLPLVKLSQEFSELLNLHGLTSVEINGNSENREKILEDFHNGEYQVLCNSMLLTEGWDEPSVDCIVVLRPTKIRSLYEQMVGRGTRLSEGKKDLLLLDFLWLSEKHSLCHPANLFCESEDEAKRVTDKVANFDGALDILDAQDEVERDIIKEREDSLAKTLEENRRKGKRLIDPIEYFLSIADASLVEYEPTMPWEMAPASQKQIDALTKWGIDVNKITSAGLASRLLSKLIARSDFNLATPKQIRALEKYGFYHVGTWSFSAASKMISVIASNSWIVPYWIDAKTFKPQED